jgi:hypothetical protein
MNPPAPPEPESEKGPAGGMPIPTTDAAGEPGTIDQRTVLLLSLGTLYGLLLLIPGGLALLDSSPTSGSKEFLAFLSVGYPLYFLPTLIVCFVRHRQTAAIFVLNVCAGWTVIGWLAALLWAIRPVWQRRRS